MAVALPEAAGEPAGDGTGAAEQRGAGHGALRTVSSEQLAIDYGVCPASDAYRSHRDGVYLYIRLTLVRMVLQRQSHQHQHRQERSLFATQQRDRSPPRDDEASPGRRGNAQDPRVGLGRGGGGVHHGKARDEPGVADKMNNTKSTRRSKRR